MYIKTLSDVISDHASAYVGKLTTKQKKDVLFVQTLLHMLNDDVSEASMSLGDLVSSDRTRLLNMAASLGKAEMVKAITACGRVSTSEALIQAANQGHVDCMKEVYPAQEGTKKALAAVLEAINNKQEEALNFLWSTYFPKAVENHLDESNDLEGKIFYYSAKGKKDKAMSAQAALTKKVLQEAVGTAVSSTRFRRM